MPSSPEPPAGGPHRPSSLRRLLVANRGEVAVRVLDAARDAGLETVAVYAEDDHESLHVRRADSAVAVPGRGPRAYLDIDQLLAVARSTGADSVHPGWGFLSESAEFARRCQQAGLTFVGPHPATLELLGDKAAARDLAVRCGVPVLPGTSGPTTLAEARAFLANLGPGGAVMVKAVAGGGGRGMRAVLRPEDLTEAFERCQSEASAAFGRGDVYVERLLPTARHIEVQIVGDGSGAVSHLGERECSIQRHHQKLIEVAPSPGLPEPTRRRLFDAAVRLAAQLRYLNVGTFEFLVDTEEPQVFAFIEANPRLQVEHTVTEAVTGLDLVQIQFALASGASLDSLRLRQDSVPPPRGFAVQARVNLETMRPDGTARPAGGVLTSFEAPTGPGTRVDTFGYRGYRTSHLYDSLLAKVITHVPAGDWTRALAKARLALSEFHIEGAGTNIPFLLNVLAHDHVVSGRLYTRFIDEHAAELCPPDERAPTEGRLRAGADIDRNDPLAVLVHGKTGTPPRSASVMPAPGDGLVPVVAPMQGTVISIDRGEGDQVVTGQQLLVLEAMKMEHVVTAPVNGVLRRSAATVGDAVHQGQPLAYLERAAVNGTLAAAEVSLDLDLVRADLAEVHHRHHLGLDAARPEAVTRRRKTGQRTTRENIADLCDPNTFVEYGPLVIAAQRLRRPVQELIERTPADGLVGGVGRVNGDHFDPAHTRCVVMSYDYTVLAGTQGHQNHRKKDRLFDLAERQRLPVVLFAEGGGGRPGDTDGLGVAGLDCLAFYLFGRLSGLVPLVGITSGRCFAGNAALLGSCDVVIATKDSTIGMGGPAMIEGGGLGIYRPEEVGPAATQAANGVIDILVDDEATAVAAAKQYLSYFQGRTADWACPDQRILRHLVPENRLRAYDVRQVITALADTDSVLELRQHFGTGMITALARIEGRPLGIVANNPGHLGGAIDPDGADKAVRFMQLCDAHDLPILFLCDTPGFMVGPEVESAAMVRHACRLFVTGSSLTVPIFTIVLRKGYGLGAQAMAGGSFKAPLFTVAWPTGEFGGMGLEGAVKLGYRKELEALTDPEQRRALYDKLVAEMYERGKALNTASHFEIDDVIDPVDSRRWVSAALESAPPAPRSGKKRACIDTW